MTRAPTVASKRPLARRLRTWLALYALVLVASHLVRVVRDGAPPLPEGMARVELGAQTARGPANGRVSMAYLELGAGRGDPVLLVHGSPGSHRELRALAEGLSATRHVLVPDLPGFGASRAKLPDYSFRAHARYLAEWLEGLDLAPVHVVGFSMGGGVALELSELAPDRVRSITLLSAIGVQELEWLGDYHMNRALHALQLAVLWGARELVPHFGALDGAMLGVEYARNFFDSDQRPLRGILERYQGPMRILHGEQDPLVPLAAAEEHRRIVPQAGLDLFAGHGHFMVFTDPEVPLGALERFLGDVESGAAPTRERASAVRLAQAAVPYDPKASAPLTGFALHAVLTMLALSTLVSEDLACVGAGALAAQGRITLFHGALACFVGIYVGDLLLFLAGRLLGRRALRYRPLSYWLSEADVEQSARWFQRRGLAAIFLSRFLPGTRLPTYFAAGAVGASAWRFALFFALAAGLWTPILVWISSSLSGELSRRVEAFQGALPVVFLAVLAAVLLLVKVVLPACTWRGRRQLLGRYQRWRHWEFWPAWLFYPPVVAYILYLAFVRWRRPMLFAAANPALPLGGLVNESKREILAGLVDVEPARMRVARWEALPAGLSTQERLTRIRAFQAREGLGFPLVLKPDAGQRGSGVLVARDEAALEQYLEQSNDDLIVQEFASGPEYGVFYVRVPGEPRGRILSLTDKRLATVCGDGRRTLEQLILGDPRAVAMQRYYLRKNADRLESIPAAGETVAIGDLGTHARGAIFLDGGHLATEPLLETVEQFTASFAGFCFGRFDVRVPSEAHLTRGEGLVVLELNGVTSESTSIYDRRHGVLHAWGTLWAQWRLCFEIGALNAKAGVPLPRLLDALEAVRSYRARAKGRPGG